MPLIIPSLFFYFNLQYTSYLLMQLHGYIIGPERFEDVYKRQGHINVAYDEALPDSKEIQTLGCPDCSAAPLACSVPTLHEGLDGTEDE